MTDFIEKASDCYMTPKGQVDLVALMWPEGVDLDPFWDPETLLKSHEHFDISEGQDAYKRVWGLEGDKILVNGPYSGSNPAKTAKRCAMFATAGRDIANLCPAAPGSVYWKEWVWPRVHAIAWLGRLSFVAGRDQVDGKGKVTHEKGTLMHGNRTEIAMNYQGANSHTFVSLWRSKGFPVTVVRS